MNQILEGILVEKAPEISSEIRTKILKFYQLLLEENDVQNLTRLIEPEDFFYGHLVDVLELLKSNLVRYPAMDLGSGGGVPGLLAALFTSERWILCDSEKKKAEFLLKAVNELGLGFQVEVTGQRAEEYLKKHSVQSITARAVGPVDRIYSWIRPCSTWNNLVLLKGPGWQEEWARFQTEKRKNELSIAATHAYSVGPENKSRLIIQISRVPRGTK